MTAQIGALKYLWDESLHLSLTHHKLLTEALHNQYLEYEALRKVLADILGVTFTEEQFAELAALYDPYQQRLVDGTMVLLQLFLMNCEHMMEVASQQLQESFSPRHPQHAEVVTMLQKVIAAATDLDYASLAEYAYSWEPAGSGSAVVMDAFDFKQEVKAQIRLDFHGRDLIAARFYYGGGETSIKADVFMADLLRRAYCAQLHVEEKMCQIIGLSSATTDSSVRDASTDSIAFGSDTIETWSANNSASISAAEKIQRLANEHLGISLRLEEAREVQRWMRSDAASRNGYATSMLKDALSISASSNGVAAHNRSGNGESKHATQRLVLKVAIAACKQVPLHRQLQANAKVLLSATELAALMKRSANHDGNSLLEAFNALAHKMLPSDDIVPVGSYERNMLTGFASMNSMSTFEDSEKAFGEEDYQSALDKLAHASASTDRQSVAAFDVFQCSVMSADDFHRSLQDVLRLTFTTAEFAAILGMLDPRQTGAIDCQKFLNQFYRLGNDHRDRMKREARRQQQEINERRRILMQGSSSADFTRLDHRAEADQAIVWTIDDLSEGLRKLISNFLTDELRLTRGDKVAAFSVAYLPSAHFARMLVQNFNLRVSDEQLQAITAFFMDDEEGEIDCIRFRSTLQRAAVQIQRLESPTRDQTSIISEIVAALVSNVDIESLGEDFKRDAPKIVKINRGKPPGSADKKLELRLAVAKSSWVLDLACNVAATINGPSGANVADLRLTVVPEEVFQLKQLRELWLCNNSLETLPESIGDLGNLTRMSLCRNHIKSLPVELCGLSKLRCLDLQQNRIEQLPMGFGNLIQLEQLNLAHNFLGLLPAEVVELPKLQELDISYNRVTHLGSELQRMKLLLILNVIGNQLSPESHQILARMRRVELRMDGRPSHPDRESDDIVAMLKSRAASNVAQKQARCNNSVQPSSQPVPFPK